MSLYPDPTTFFEKTIGPFAHNLARLKRETGLYDEAITYYEMALKNVDNPLIILKKMTEYYHFQNDYVNCVVMLTQALMHGAPLRIHGGIISNMH